MLGTDLFFCFFFCLFVVVGGGIFAGDRSAVRLGRMSL